VHALCGGSATGNNSNRESEVGMIYYVEGLRAKIQRLPFPTERELLRRLVSSRPRIAQSTISRRQQCFYKTRGLKSETYHSETQHN